MDNGLGFFRGLLIAVPIGLLLWWLIIWSALKIASALAGVP